MGDSLPVMLTSSSIVMPRRNRACSITALGT